MNFNTFVILCFYIIHLTSCEIGKSLQYKAGVVEYFYHVRDQERPKLVLQRNVNNYVQLIKQFNKTLPNIKDGILVFPECGLTSSSNKSYYPVPVPEPDLNQYNFSGFEVIYPISNAARKYKKWVVINLVEQDGYDTYNTDVVFASNGTIAAKYRKYNLFEDSVKKPRKPEVVSFTTDFKVTFGIFTCFDILFSRPTLDLVANGIKHFIFPTAWFSELPFLTAIQIQKGWSWSNDVSLLAAGLSNSKLGNTGSGIYRGRKGHDIFYQTTNSNASHLIVSVFDSKDEDFFINERVEYTTEEMKKDVPDKTQSELKLMHESLNAYTTSLITPEGCQIQQTDLKQGMTSNCTKRITKKLINHGLQCEFNVTAVFSVYICTDNSCKDAKLHLPNMTKEDDFSQSQHRLAAFSGVRSFYVTTGGVQTCAIIPCRDKKLSSCALTPVSPKLHCFHYSNQRVCVMKRFVTHVNIRGNFSTNHTMVTPNILLRSNIPSQFGKITNDFKMNHFNGRYNLLYDVPDDEILGTAAIWSRDFRKDGQKTTNSATSLAVSNFITTIIITIALMNKTSSS